MPAPSRRQFLQGKSGSHGLGLLTGSGLSVGCSRLPLDRPSADAPVRRIGLLGLGSLSSYHSVSMQQRLTELGWVEGENIVTERRSIMGAVGQAQLDGWAVELVKLPVSLIVAMGSAAALAAKRATTTIPVVMVGSADPVALGLVTSLGRPGGNVTGLGSLAVELSAKRLQFLKEVLPDLKRVAVIWSAEDLDSQTQFQATKQAAQSLSATVDSLELRQIGDAPRRLADAKQAGTAGLIVLDQAGSLGDGSQVPSTALELRLPSIADDRWYAARLAGGLMAYGPNHNQQARRAAEYVDKILRGANPADLPVEQPSQFDFAINLHTAQILDVTIPQTVLLQATEIN